MKIDSFITKKEIPNFYNISIRTFDRYRNILKIKSFKQGKKILFDKKEIDEKIQQLIQLQSSSKDNDYEDQNINIIIKKNEDKENKKATKKTITENYIVNDTNQILSENKNISNNNYNIIYEGNLPINTAKNEDKYLEFLQKKIDDLQSEIKQKNQIIEAANYKIGKLDHLNNLNNKLIGEINTYKKNITILEKQISEQEKKVFVLKTLFYTLIAFIFILVIFEIFLFSLLFSGY